LQCYFQLLPFFSGAAQTSVLEPPELRYATFGATFTCGLVAFILFRKSPHNESAISALRELINTSSEFNVTLAVSEAEAREVWRLDVANFNDHHVPLSIGVAWWKKFSSGLYVLKKDGKIFDYISFWPLAQKSFKEFVSGQRLETSITSRSICPPLASAQTTWWYIGSISLLARFQKTKAVRKLIFCAIDDWTSKLDPASTINVCALAYSDEGEKLLRKFGFHCFANANESPHKLPVYIYEASVNEFKQQFNQLFRHVQQE